MTGQSPGTVYLVGAGPGDPGLLTQRAAALLATAEVIAYDALISPAILTHANPKAEMFGVGYRGYGSSRLTHRMHPRVVERALSGQSVVRLKSGDPWIFGRAAQECEELLENQIPFEVVPGITAAIGAAAYAGFPLTHRDTSSDVVLTSGHDLRGDFNSNSDWNALARCCGTLVIYMAGSKVAENCARLIQMGKPPGTPAALLAHGTRGSQRLITGTLSTLADQVDDRVAKLASVIVVGETVALHERFSWFDKKPLHDLTVLVARARPGASVLAALLRDNGADIIEAPWVQSVALSDYSALDGALANLPIYRNLVFSSADAVDFFWDRLSRVRRDARSLHEFSITAIGRRVSDRLSARGLNPDAVTDGQCLDAIEAIGDVFKDKRSLVITSSREHLHLRAAFRSIAAEADFISAHDYEVRFPNIEAPNVDFVILPSSTSAQLLLDGPWGQHLRDTPMIAIGPKTRHAAVNLGARRVEQTEKDHFEDILSLLLRLKGGRTQS